MELDGCYQVYAAAMQTWWAYSDAPDHGKERVHALLQSCVADLYHSQGSKKSLLAPAWEDLLDDDDYEDHSDTEEIDLPQSGKPVFFYSVKTSFMKS